MRDRRRTFRAESGLLGLFIQEAKAGSPQEAGKLRDIMTGAGRAAGEMSAVAPPPEKMESKLKELPVPAREVAEAIRESFPRKIKADLLLKKSAEWAGLPEFRAISIPEEIRLAAQWCRDNPRRAPRSDYSRFLGSWLRRAAGRARVLPDASRRVIRFFSDRFMETHGGEPPEMSPADEQVLHEMVLRRNAYSVLVLIDGFFQTDGASGFRIFPGAGRSVSAFRSQVNKMLGDAEVRTYLEKKKADGEEWFVQNGYLAEKHRIRPESGLDAANGGPAGL